MKILFAHDHIFLEYKNGIYSKGGLNEEILKEYLQYGDQLTVLARSKKLNFIPNKSEIKNKYINFKFLHSISNLKNLFFLDKAIKKDIEEEVKQADIIVVRLPSEIGNRTYDIAKEQNKKIIVEVVASAKESLWYIGTIKSKLYAYFADYRMRKRIKEAQYVMYVANCLNRKYPTEGEKIICSDVKLLTKPFYKTKNKIVKKIGIIASLNSKIKGIDLILKAVKLLVEKDKIDICLEIVGSGNKDYWRNIINKLNLNNNVKFLGTLNSEEIIEWLDQIDIYLQPSYTEGLSRATIEAMSRRLPIIATKVGDFEELLDDNMLIKKGDYTDLYYKIKELYLNEKLRIHIGERNYKKSLKYNLSKIQNKKSFIWDKVKGLI